MRKISLLLALAALFPLSGVNVMAQTNNAMTAGTLPRPRPRKSPRQ